MDELPTGLVTLLFTDVQGSTRLLEQLGHRYAAVLTGHDTILRTSIQDEGGRVVDTAGDGFFAVFPSPLGAVRAAVRAQQELAGTEWPDGVAVSVRMGLHTGEAVLDGARYVGLEVHRAARIAAAAHGGQVLLSAATRAVVGDGLPPGTGVRDIGVHQLKDVTRPERLYQLTVDGLPQDFPPPRTIDARPGNLPTRLTPFVGRREQLVQIRALIREHRLVTLTGPGGTGKTRLALQVAADSITDFTDGAFFVDLSSTADPALVPAAVAAALGVVEQPGRPLAAVVTAHLEHKRLLLVLDNVEQVTEAAGFLSDVLAAAAEVRVLATSRVPLHLYGEREFAVPPLALPDPGEAADPDALGRYEAVALFVQRASSAVADFRLTAANAAAVAEITARLDGLPLAIELAAGRVKVLPPQRLLSRLERRLPLLTAAERDVPERQRTLRATIGWSNDLLPEAEQHLFRRLAVFTGGAGLDAVEAVANPGGELGDTLDLLEALVDGNLVRGVDGTGEEPRFGMLETIREFALEQLSRCGEEPAVRRRHAEYWLQVGERATDALLGPDQATWVRRLDDDVDNLRAALDWSVQAGAPDLGMRLAVALDDYWRLASHVWEGVDRLTTLLALDRGIDRPLLRARALTVLAGLHGWIDDPERMAGAAGEALEIYRDRDDPSGVADAIETLGWAELQRGHLEPARRHITDAIDRFAALGKRHRAAAALPALGIIAELEGDLSRARHHYEAASLELREVGDRFMAAMTEFMIGGVDRQEGDLESAGERFRTGLSTYLDIDNAMGVSWALYAFADLALQYGRPARALRLVGASDRLRAGAEMPALVTVTLGDVGQLARQQLDAGTAEQAYRRGHDMGMDDAVAYAREDRPGDNGNDRS